MSENPQTPPPARDWQGWLFVLLAVAALAGVLWDSGRSTPPSPLTLSKPVAPPADVIPAVAPVELAEVTLADARAANALIPFVTANLRVSAPFRFGGGPEEFQRARDCLAAALLYEAGDDDKGQRAVAQVVLNRARHPAFPKSVCGVVFQGSERTTGCQFTFTCDGALARRYTDLAWLRAQSVAMAALNGAVDPSVGLATHYHTDWVRPYWSDSLEKIAAVDTHLFFRWPGFWGTPGAFRSGLSGSEPLIGKLAGLSTAHGIAPGLATEGLATTNPIIGDPVVKTDVGAISGNSRDTLLVVLDRRATSDAFVAYALRVCGTRDYCKLFGWTNPVLKPGSEAMTDMQRTAMSFSYLRDDSADFEKALWNCTEYPRDDARQCMKR
ncbi:MAG: cell wall hydrolase [Sphingopyxis sp.]|nr:cell wall hydrolase [Sphingopyxis sp.]